MLQELETHGICDARQIAERGPGGRGWWIKNRKVELKVDEDVYRKDPTGKKRWERVCELGREVAEGKNIRLLCHCRRTRQQGIECKACHCEPTAEHIEHQARRIRREMEEKEEAAAALREAV